MPESNANAWDGPFGLKLQGFLNRIRVDQREEIRSLMGSSRDFMQMVVHLNSRIKTIESPAPSFLDRKPHEFVGRDGWVYRYTPTTYSPSLDVYSGTESRVNRRGLAIVRSENGTYYEPSPKAILSLLNEDVIHIMIPDELSAYTPHLYRDRPPASEGFLFRLLRSLAHEMRHAVEHYSRVFSHPGRPVQSGRLRDFIDEEIRVRQAELAVARQIGDPTAQRGFKPRSVAGQIALVENGVQRPDVERSFTSRLPLKTYVEDFYVAGLVQRLPSLVPAEIAQMVRNETDALWEKEEFGQSGLAKLRDEVAFLKELKANITELSQSKQESDPADVYAIIYLIEKVVGARWERLLDQHGQSTEYFMKKEQLLKEHATALFTGTGIAYTQQLIHHLQR